MARDLLMPKLGLTMTEGVLAEWRVAPGSPFKAGDVLLVVETDKIANEVEAERDGVLLEALVPAGETAAVGAVIARWSTDADAAAVPPPGETVTAPSPAIEPAAPGNGRLLATPLARRRAGVLGIDLTTVRGTGPRGRIKVADVETAAQAVSQAVSPAAVPVPMPDTAIPAVPPTDPRPVPAAAERSRPGTAQATMARRLTAAKRDVPHFYLAAEAEVSELLLLRERLNADAPAGGVKLSLNHLVMGAVGRALAAMPEFDRVWEDGADGGSILSLGRGDIGMAVSTPRGLVAPLLRGAAFLPLDRLAAEAATLTERARAGRLTAEDFAGGAVSVSNAGMHNVTYMTSIISPGQSSILGVGSVRSVFRPDEAGAPVLKREIGLVLSADHRLFDGVTALSFLNRIIAGLERPLRLLRDL